MYLAWPCEERGELTLSPAQQTVGSTVADSNGAQGVPHQRGLLLNVIDDLSPPQFARQFCLGCLSYTCTKEFHHLSPGSCIVLRLFLKVLHVLLKFVLSS